MSFFWRSSLLTISKVFLSLVRKSSVLIYDVLACVLISRVVYLIAFFQLLFYDSDDIFERSVIFLPNI